MAKTLDLTLAIPLYNSSGSLPNLIQSLESQTVLPTEIIFLDDASPDNSRDLAEDFSRKYPEVELVYFIEPYLDMKRGRIDFFSNNHLSKNHTVISSMNMY